MIDEGTYLAKATEWDLGLAETGNEQIVIEFTIAEGPLKGQKIPFYGSFSDKALAYTVEKMRACGWTGNDLSDLHGIGSNQVEITVEHHEYKGKVSARVGFVNIPGAVRVKQPLSDSQRKAFAARMKSNIAAIDAAKGTPPRREVRRETENPDPNQSDAITDDDLRF